MTDTPEGPTGSDRSGPANDEKVEMPRREKWLRLALITVGAALIASIFSVWSQRSDDDPTAAAGETVGTSSGTVTVDIDVDADGSARSVQLVNRYRGADFDATLSTTGDASSYSSSTFTQNLIALDGSHYYRSSDTEEWEPTDGPSIVELDAGIALPPGIVGWSTTGLDALLTALDLPDGSDGAPVAATITVAEARALEALPVAVEVIVDPDWAWADDQPIDVTVTLAEGRIEQLTAQASDDGGTRPDGPLSISTVTAYRDLGGDVSIEAPSN
ncbi:MAG: hypothetical protein OEV40_02975 [Acidimicrobiia bacterium]|nr:hypothetical protein [Acidimicrobiia bacterium]